MVLLDRMLFGDRFSKICKNCPNPEKVNTNKQTMYFLLNKNLEKFGGFFGIPVFFVKTFVDW